MRYRTVVEPALARAALFSDWRIFQQQSVACSTAGGPHLAWRRRVGGVVLEAFENTNLNGKPVALNGMKTACGASLIATGPKGNVQ